MAKCHRNNVDPLNLHRIPSASSSSSTSLNSFSRSTFRRLILDAISCGASSRHQRQLQQDQEDKTTIGSKSGDDDLATTKSEKLCDLLDTTKMEKKKEETLEILKRVVKDLEAEEKKAVAASEVRLLAKDDTEARVSLAMLGAIPPLVGMIDDDSQNEDAQIASLYALLNLGIGNDA